MNLFGNAGMPGTALPLLPTQPQQQQPLLPGLQNTLGEPALMSKTRSATS